MDIFIKTRMFLHKLVFRCLALKSVVRLFNFENVDLNFMAINKPMTFSVSYVLFVLSLTIFNVGHEVLLLKFCLKWRFQFPRESQYYQKPIIY